MKKYLKVIIPISIIGIMIFVFLKFYNFNFFKENYLAKSLNQIDIENDKILDTNNQSYRAEEVKLTALSQAQIDAAISASGDATFKIHTATVTSTPQWSDIMTFDDGIKVKGIVNSRNSTMLTVTFNLEASECFKKVSCGDVVVQPTQDQSTWKTINIDVTADFYDTVKLDVEMAVGKTYEILYTIK